MSWSSGLRVSPPFLLKLGTVSKRALAVASEHEARWVVNETMGASHRKQDLSREEIYCGGGVNRSGRRCEGAGFAPGASGLCGFFKLLFFATPTGLMGFLLWGGLGGGIMSWRLTARRGRGRRRALLRSRMLW